MGLVAYAARNDDDVDEFRAYLKAIARTPLLTAAEEIDLAMRISGGVVASHLLASIDSTAGRGVVVSVTPLTPQSRRSARWLDDAHSACRTGCGTA